MASGTDGVCERTHPGSRSGSGWASNRCPTDPTGTTNSPPSTPGPSRVAGRPVRANMITSLDGGAAIDGRSGGLGNEADQHLFAVLRDLADVILVGSGTVRAEQYAGIRLDPQRRARRTRWGLPAGPAADRRGHRPRPGRGPAAVHRHRDAADRDHPPGGRRRGCPRGADALIAGDDEVDLAAAIRGLADRGFRRIHCEGGPGLLGQLVAHDLLDECCLTIAPLFLGSGATRLLPTDLADPVGWTPSACASPGRTCSPATGGSPAMNDATGPANVGDGYVRRAGRRHPAAADPAGRLHPGPVAAARPGDLRHRPDHRADHRPPRAARSDRADPGSAPIRSAGSAARTSPAPTRRPASSSTSTVPR